MRGGERKKYTYKRGDLLSLTGKIYISIKIKLIEYL